MVLHQDSEVFETVTLRATTYSACYRTALLHPKTRSAFCQKMDLNGLCDVSVPYFRAGAAIFAGEYQDEIRSTECKRCAIGMYQDTLAAVLRQSHCFVHI